MSPTPARPFIEAYCPRRPWGAAGVRALQALTYEDLLVRDKCNLDISWLWDDSLDDLDNLPGPAVIAREVVEDLTAALAEFEAVAAALEDAHMRRVVPPTQRGAEVGV